MKKLDMLASKEEEKLERAEQLLEDDATLFDEFLKENDRNSVEAVKMLVVWFALVVLSYWHIPLLPWLC